MDNFDFERFKNFSFIQSKPYFIMLFTRLWDVRELKEVNSITLDSTLCGMQLSSDGSVLSVACGNKVAFYDSQR